MRAVLLENGGGGGGGFCGGGGGVGSQFPGGTSAGPSLSPSVSPSLSPSVSGCPARCEPSPSALSAAVPGASSLSSDNTRRLRLRWLQTPAGPTCRSMTSASPGASSPCPGSSRVPPSAVSCNCWSMAKSSAPVLSVQVPSFCTSVKSLFGGFEKGLSVIGFGTSVTSERLLRGVASL